MNILYLILPLAAGLIVGVLLISQWNITTYIVSPEASNNSSNETNIQQKIENETRCPGSCDDNNACTIDWCNETSSYSCFHTAVNGATSECWGSVGSCKRNTCISGKCVVILEKNCCGNTECEQNEDCLKCPEDCGKCPITEPIPTTPQPIQQQEIEQPPETPTQPQQQNIPPPVSLNHIVISELTTRGPSGAYDEFVELYNPTNDDIDITGWKLQYKSASGDTWQNKVGSGISGVIKSKSFYLLASKEYSYAVTPDYLHDARWGFADKGGHARIIDNNSITIDKVGYGNASDPEGSPAPTPEEGKSLHRKSLTVDTDNNSQDFSLIGNPSPKNP